ncbi:hypothetical protein [Mycolicibacterium palauense]|uniref:hypothetical protein n=1 Tax=Mycolicibacterium palauense TaxID=2034511 RepID=UPI000BFED4F3|nr:hypothetical protein [Mycolicibacterium palauense]
MATGEPTVPLRIAELLFVAFSLTIAEVEETTDYPAGKVENVRALLDMYDRERREVLQKKGLKSGPKYTAAAAEALRRWLNARTAESEKREGDFDEWTRELGEEGTPDDHGPVRP